MPVAVPVAALAVVLLVVGLLYFRYRTSPAGRWKAQVGATIGAHQARLRRARSELAAINTDSADRELRNKFLDQQLEGVAVEELAKYPRIGPVTVSRLREAGLSTVAACGRARLSAVPGIGPSREADLKDALKKVRREAESRFDAGASPQAAAYAAERKKRQADRESRRQSAQEEVRRAEAVLAGLRERARLAAGVTFVGHLMDRTPAGLTSGVMAWPLVTAELVPGPASRERQRPESSPAQTPVAAASAPVADAPGSPGAGSAAVRAAHTSRPANQTLGAASHAAGTGALPGASPLTRLRTVAGLGLAVAKADGRIANAERKQVRAFLERRYSPDPELAGKLNAVMAEVEAGLPTLGDALWDVKQKIPSDAWPELYQLAVSVADAAGERNTRKVECLARIAEELGIVPETAGILPAERRGLRGDVPLGGTVAGRMPAVPGTELECRAALEIAPETPLSVDLIRRQHRLLADRFAPEKFTTHGPDFMKMAADKRDKAERAARHLLAGYNEPLEPPAAPPPPADLRHNPDLDDVFGA